MGDGVFLMDLKEEILENTESLLQTTDPSPGDTSENDEKGEVKDDPSSNQFNAGKQHQHTRIKNELGSEGSEEGDYDLDNEDLTEDVDLFKIEDFEDIKESLDVNLHNPYLSSKERLQTRIQQFKGHY